MRCKLKVQADLAKRNFTYKPQENKTTKAYSSQNHMKYACASVPSGRMHALLH